MAKFNQKNPDRNKPDTINRAGGQAHTQSNEIALASLLLTSFMADVFYEKESALRQRLKTLIDNVSPQFAAQAAVFARREFGMRSVTHYTAAHLGRAVSGTSWGRSFYDAIVRRPDDMLEIASLVEAEAGGKLSNAMKAGFADALLRFGPYQLAKYRGEGRKVNMFDIVNMVHPKPLQDQSRAAFKALMKGALKNEDTWEAMLSAAGSDTDRKSLAWGELLTTGKIGYFALLRNMRNIVQQAPEQISTAVTLLTDPKRIKNSLVLPFRYIQAFDEVMKMETSSAAQRHALLGITKALDIATVENVPKLDGETLVVLDCSASMGSISDRKKPAAIGGLFAAVMLKSWMCDFMLFSDNARYRKYNPADSVIGIINAMNFRQGGTNFHDIFRVANKPYKRIIILSDMQGWIPSYNNQPPIQSFNNYKKRHACEPVIYSFDLAGMGDMQFPEHRVACMAGFSEKVFDFMRIFENGGVSAMVERIKQTQFSADYAPGNSILETIDLPV